MVYISADGSIGEKRPRNAFQSVCDAFFSLKPQWKAVALACLAFALRGWLNPNPLANGKIPAAELEPNQHWNRIMKDPTFMRSMTEHLSSRWFSANNKASHSELLTETDDMKIALGLVDFGGPDGHVAEAGDWSNVEYVRGTRCSTTQSAITAYFCGADVAKNQDVALENKRKHYRIGVKSFADFISCRHQQSERNGGSHRRSVYRLGVGTEDGLSGYSHAFSIIAQPDGSFFWLQSFISHYSLTTWMEKVDGSGTPLGHLSLNDVLAKLEQVDRLMKISGWSFQANNDYYELFGVNKEKEARDRAKPPVHMTWKPTHRLHVFYWDEACEYPVPVDDKKGPQPLDNNASDNDNHDECVAQSLLKELKEFSTFGFA